MGVRVGLVAPVVAWAALIFYLSSLPNPPGQPSEEWVSYAAHLTEYAVLGFLSARLLSGQFGSLGGAAWVVAWAAAAASGVSDEVHQAFGPGRDATPVDWLFDAAGALAGVLTWLAWSRVRSPG